MTTDRDSLRDENIISDSQVTDRIDYLAFLDDDDMSESDRELWADEIEELKALRQLVEAIGDEFGAMISDDHWKKYAGDDANDKWDLDKTGIASYFDYDQYASDLQTDFSSVEFLGTTYYYGE
jgi:hypothetical protein